MKKSNRIKKILEIIMSDCESTLRFIKRMDGKKDESPQYELLDQKLLRQLIPGYGDLNQAAQKRALKKLLHGIKFHRYKLDLDIPPFSKKICIRTGFGSLKKEPAAEELAASAKALIDLARAFESPTAGSCLLGQILVGFHADEAEKALGVVPALEFRNVGNDIANAIVAVFRTIAPSRKKEQDKLCYRRNPIVDFREDELTSPTPLDLSCVKVKGKRGTKVAVPITDTPVLIVGAAGKALREFSASLSAAAVTYLNCSGRDRDVPTMMLNNRDLLGFSPEIIEQVVYQADGVGCILRRWWENRAMDWRTVPEHKDEPGRRYYRLEKLRNDELSEFYEAIVHSFIDFLAEDGMLSDDNAAILRDEIVQRFHPISTEEIEEVPPTFDNPTLFLTVIGDIIAKYGARVMCYGEKREPGKRPIGGWRTIGEERFLVLLEEEVERLYPKLAEAHGVPVSDFQSSGWLTDLLKAMGKAGVLKLPTKGFHYTYDLVGRGRDVTKVLAIHAELVEGEKSGDDDMNVSHSSPAISPNNSNGNNAASH